MNQRQAVKIVKRQAIRCRLHIDGPEDTITAGCNDYGAAAYHKALRIVFRKQDQNGQW